MQKGGQSCEGGPHTQVEHSSHTVEKGVFAEQKEPRTSHSLFLNGISFVTVMCE